MDATKHSSSVAGSNPRLDDRAERLLSICSDLAPYENRITRDEFGDFIESAVFACGFHSVEEACESLLGPDQFRIWLKVMRAVVANTQLKERTEDKLSTRPVRNPSPRRRTGYC